MKGPVATAGYGGWRVEAGRAGVILAVLFPQLLPKVLFASPACEALEDRAV